MSSKPRQQLSALILMIAAIFCAIIVAAGVLRFGKSHQQQRTTGVAKAAKRTSTAVRRGVHGRITAGEVSVERTLPALSFTLHEGQSLDARVAAAPFEAEFTVRFHPGNAQFARIGAEIQNGSLIVKQGDSVLLSDVAGAEGKVSLNLVPISLTRRIHELTYIFKTDGGSPIRLRALWQPDSAAVPLPLPSEGEPLLADDAIKGLALVQQFNCAACHVSADPNLQAELHVSPAPDLALAGARLKPEWIRKWLADPAASNSESQMPRLFHGEARDAEQVEDLTHFLVSLGGPLDRAALLPDPDIISTGMVAYHTVGCVACHGPLEPLEHLPGARKMVGGVTESYTPLGHSSQKTTTGQLAEMLRNPLKVYPSGRMPSLALSDLEAESIASYLMARDSERHGEADATRDSEIDAARVERGREHFEALGCANCHVVALGPERQRIASKLTAPPLESLAQAGGRGCMADAASPSMGAPAFALSKFKRQAISAFLSSIEGRRNADVPIDRLASAMARLNCTACHQFHGDLGPEPAITQYFTTVVEADLGDEGRLPPPLSDVGAKLNPGWLTEMLEGDRRSRPYMGVRMPEFGTFSVGNLPADFACAAGVNSLADHGPQVSPEHAVVGRELVGSKGFNCIQCHTIAGRDSTGTPGPDLAAAAERLRFDSFARWLHDPKLVRPGTRMPSFFVNGRSGFIEHLEGDAEKQVQAIWAYLSQGQQLPLPEGLVDPSGLELQVGHEPIVFRTFIKQAGVRAIACGFPERIHCAFDADKCRLALVWQGDFLNAQGAWAARGGTQTNPSDAVWTANDSDVIQLNGEAAELHFRGYRLDAERRPIFMYEASHGEIRVQIHEQPLPMRENGKGKLIRRFSIQGPPKLRIDLHSMQITIDASGAASADLEVKW